MNAREVIDRTTDTGDQTNLCVVLRGVGSAGLEALLVADELGRWSIPGGHTQDTESHAEACVREVREETGLDVEVQPLMWADHVARKIPANVFYAIVTDGGDQIKPGGGDVTKVWWAPVSNLGPGLNGTDRLVIQVAANRVHDPQGLVDDAAMQAESQGFAVAEIVARPAPLSEGIHIQLRGAAAMTYLTRLHEWATSLQWPTQIVQQRQYDSTTAALERASRQRKLTPMLEAMLLTADAVWHYDSTIAKRLHEGVIILEASEGIAQQHLLNRGMPADLLENMLSRIPQPTVMLDVGDTFNTAEFQMLKDSIEQMKNADNKESTVDGALAAFKTIVENFTPPGYTVVNPGAD